MSKSNKLDKQQLDQINSLEEGLFSPLFKKLVSGRLKRTLKKLERDPALRDAFKRFDKSLEDLERDLEASAEIDSSVHTNDRDVSSKERQKLYKDLGLL
tara:strand:+ start:1182 stop:1478 length:297 start_codon:yes stop_codon:yes gene_type:complete